MSELLPRPVRLLLGATSPGISDSALREAVAGKVVLITGASSGVGEAAAVRLGRAGATVLLVARRAELLDEVRDAIADYGGSAFAYPCDLADVDQVGELVETVLADHGHVDVVVSNAGKSIRRWISDSYDRFHDMERTIRVNYLGPVRLLLGLLPSMRERQSGHIVNVATAGVNLPAMRWSAYIASKTALEVWLGGVAPEIKADGVTTTSIHLQLVRSPMLGPFRMWNYLPGMSTDEAADIIARAIVKRPRTISPLWARMNGVAYQLAQGPIEAGLSAYAARMNRGRSARRALPPPGPRVAGPAVRLAEDVLRAVTTTAEARVIRPVRPDRLARAMLAARRYGPTPAAAVAAAAEVYGDRVAVTDERGQMTFRELDDQSRSLAGALHEQFGLGAASGSVGIMCRNHRGFIQAAAAATRLGCDLVPLNSDFAGPQLADVVAREGVTAAVYDEEFDHLFDDAEFTGARVLGWHEHGTARPTIDSLVAVGASDAPAPASYGRIVMLTSGTTGTPKGAARTINPRSLAPLALASLLDLARIRPAPRAGEPIVVPPPLFHLYGQVGFGLGCGLGSAILLRRRFDPEATLDQIERHRAGMLLAVPTMLKRIIDLPADVRDGYDTSSLRIIVSGAAPLSPDLAQAVMDQFGDILYNGYASTEVGMGTLATPSDLREAPGTVGKPSAGVRIRILGEDGIELPRGKTGRIFVGSPLLFDGYTGGGGKEVIDGLMSTGDVGHFDDGGRLFIDGRDDDMILSGGENVFPQEVEELLATHDAVADAAVFGVPDEDFGQRLAALIVGKPGTSVSPDELQSYVKTRLARHKVPREIEFADSIPRTSTGKIQRSKLAALHEQRVSS